jgi:thiol-disulfide isomerase/thioredoxin
MLNEDAAYCWNCGAGQATVPPQPPYQSGRPGSGRTALLAVVVAVVLIAAGVGTYLLLTGGDDNADVVNTPEMAADDFADEFDTGDIENAYNSTVYSLGDDYEGYVSSLEEAFGGYIPEVSIDESTFTDSSEMTQSEVEDAEDKVDDIESEYDVDVDDYCLMEYTASVAHDDGSEATVEGEVLCVLIDGEWYMADGLAIPYPLTGKWSMASMTGVEATMLEDMVYIMEFRIGGAGTIFVDYTDISESTDFEWSYLGGDTIELVVDGTRTVVDYAISSELLTLEFEEDANLITMTFERYSGTIDIDDGDTAGDAPDFTLPKVGGGTVSLSGCVGKVVVLDFMATWCGPCETEIEHLKDISEAYGASEVVILSIDVDSSEDDALLSGYIADHGITWDVLRDTAGINDEPGYDVTGIPTIVIIDQDGNIRFRHVGTTDSATLIAEIDTLL